MGRRQEGKVVVIDQANDSQLLPGGTKKSTVIQTVLRLRAMDYVPRNELEEYQMKTSDLWRNKE
jgi:hypothetical protein